MDNKLKRTKMSNKEKTIRQRMVQNILAYNKHWKGKVDFSKWDNVKLLNHTHPIDRKDFEHDLRRGGYQYERRA